MKKLFTSKKGSIAAVAIILMMMLAGIGSAMYFVASKNLDKVFGLQQNTIAYYNAIGGWEVARGAVVNRIVENPTLIDYNGYTNTISKGNLSTTTSKSSTEIPDMYYGTAGEADKTCLTSSTPASEDCSWSMIDRYNSASFYFYTRNTDGTANNLLGDFTLEIKADKNASAQSLLTASTTAQVVWKAWDNASPSNQTTGDFTLSTDATGGSAKKIIDFDTAMASSWTEPILSITLGATDPSISRLLYYLSPSAATMPADHITIDSIGKKGRRAYRIYSRLYQGSLNPLFIYSFVSS